MVYAVSRARAIWVMMMYAVGGNLFSPPLPIIRIMSNILSALHIPQSSNPEPQPELADCASCRIIGGTTFVGLGSYAIFQAISQAKAERALNGLVGKGFLRVRGVPVRNGLSAMGFIGAGTWFCFFHFVHMAGCLSRLGPCFVSENEHMGTDCGSAGRAGFLLAGVGRLAGLRAN